MALLNWSEKYSVNIKAIDEQHMKLIAIMNKLHEAMLKKKSKIIMGDILKELLDYTYEHFSYEEALLKKYDYPSYDEHKRTHGEMSQKVHKLYVDHQAGQEIVSRDFMDFLKNWLADHILGNDQLYKEFLHSEGVF